MLVLLFGAFLLLVVANVPIGFSLGITSMGYILLKGMPLLVLPHRICGGIDSFPLLAIPFFVLAGQLMNNGGVTRRIFGFSSELVGHIPGGLGHVNIIASIIFAGMTGSALADTAGLGTVEVKAMEEEGFDTPFSAAVTVASSTIGPIIPPSIPLVIYGVLAEVSIARLFLGGFIPGLLMGLAMMVLVYFIAKRRAYPRRKRTTRRRLVASFFDSLPSLAAPIFIVGSIVTGVASPTEAGVVAVIYALFLGGILYRELKLKDIYSALRETFQTTAVIMFVVGAAALFGWTLTREQLAIKLTQYVASISVSPVVILLAVNVLLLMLGCFMETTSIQVLLTPILAPVMKLIGVDLVHFGVVMVLNLMIGLLTPPFGMGLFVVSRVARIPVAKTIREVLPFLVPLLAVLLIITLYPPAVTWLPSILMP
ncbi:MAG: TRAP transporter large permease [Bacillota bacterium]